MQQGIGQQRNAGQYLRHNEDGRRPAHKASVLSGQAPKPLPPIPDIPCCFFSETSLAQPWRVDTRSDPRFGHTSRDFLVAEGPCHLSPASKQGSTGTAASYKPACGVGKVLPIVPGGRLCLKVNGFLAASTTPRHISASVPSGLTQPPQEVADAGPPSEKTGCTFVLARPHPCTIDAFR